MKNPKSIIALAILLLTISMKGISQQDLNCTIWEGWKLGTMIKISGTVKFGNKKMMAEQEKRYMSVEKIEDQALDKPRTIEITFMHNETLKGKLKDNSKATLMGYVSGGYWGIPESNGYQFDVWQDTHFHFEEYFIVLKEGAGIKKKK